MPTTGSSDDVVWLRFLETMAYLLISREIHFPHAPDLGDELSACVADNDLLGRLRFYVRVVQIVNTAPGVPSPERLLLRLDLGRSTVTLLPSYYADYHELAEHAQIVMMSGEPVMRLWREFPNYLSDMRRFNYFVDQALS